MNLHFYPAMKLRAMSVGSIIAFLSLGSARASHDVKEGLSAGDLPKPAEAVVKQEIASGSELHAILGVVEEMDGKTWYIARFKKAGKSKEFNFDPSGKVFSSSEDVALEVASKAIQQAISQVTPPNSTIKAIEAEKEGGEYFYTVRFSSPSEAFKFDDHGKVVTKVQKLSFAQLPQPVREGLKSVIGSATLLHGEEAEAISRKGTIIYSVDLRTPRKKVYVDQAGHRYVAEPAYLQED